MVPCVVVAHDQVPGETQSRPIAITGAAIHTVDHGVIDDGYVVFESGKISQVGMMTRKVALPDKAITIDGRGKRVYPGLIAAMSDIGLREILSEVRTTDSNEVGAINPNVRSWVAVNPDSELIPVARANGVLTALIAPAGDQFQGQAAVMSLDGWSNENMIVRAPAAYCFSLESSEPSTTDNEKRIGARETRLKAMAELLDRARRYEAAGRKGEDLVLECLLPLLHREVPLIVTAERRSTIESAVALASSQSLRLVIYGGYDAGLCASLLKQAGVSVILPGTLRAPLFRQDAFDAAYTLPNRLMAAGVPFCISGEPHGYPGGATNLRNLPYQAARAVAYGLDPVSGLRCITLSAAEILNVEDRLGSITIGKDATLMITDGDILETATQVTNAWIEGRAVDLGSHHTTLYEKYGRR